MRIIAGQYRGRVLLAPKGLHTRPTISRVREALFSILGDMENKRVVDCYAGTGALGIEALSRGARLVVFIEQDKAALQAIHKNLATLGATDRCVVIARGVGQANRELVARAPFDWVLADPPWPIAQKALLEVESATAPLVAESGGVIIGHRASEPIEPALGSRLVLQQRRRWGDSGMSFFTVR